MAAWPIHDIEPDCIFRVVREMPALPPALEAEIDALWQAAQRRMDGKLFNGRVFSADLVTPRLVCGHWTEFRRVVAQMDNHALHPRLGIRPLAVGGVISGPDGIVFGRRPPCAVYQPGEWQLPPAGSVDPSAARPDGTVDVVRQLLAELQEELGMPAASVRCPRLLGIVEHGGSHVLDLGIAVETDLTAAAIHARHTAHGNAEYDPLQVVPLPDLPQFLAGATPMLNHQAPVFLDRALARPRR